ncbi:MAG: thioredoxin [Candidatus Viridilinea halotolerans]|uniref:Thioredoxin n=1 Tax=Candidatus Viridilinea halotolerans TaxID=2491704 RepID=A0A426U932_9CHLR|nr:MAG: thioredoxin [Candidatus Viridilinea halotolerans]
MSRSPEVPSPARRRPNTLVFGALLLLVAVVLIIKGRMEAPSAELAAADLPPVAQFAQAQAAGQPMLLFFHSTTCASCLAMIDTVDAVWPAYRQQVALVSVNVYDQQNMGLIRAEGIRVIPTLVFVDRAGTRHVEIGALRPELLEQRLAALAAGH